MKTFQKIASQAISLNARERADVGQLLIQSLESSQDYEEEWLDVAEERRQQILSGEVKPVSWREIKSFVTAKSLITFNSTLK